MEVGYWLSSEEHQPNDLVRNARRAEELGFSFAMISDHYHPWLDSQGHSPFIWSVLGGISQVTERIKLGTGVTCPIMRIHPAIIAQAAATVATMMPGRFFLGIGSGENLNEHIMGKHWPAAQVRIQMMEEAVGIIRRLWQGSLTSYRGKYFTVENARIYTLPEQPPQIMIASSGPTSAQVAARVGDGLINSGLAPQVAAQFKKAGGESKPVFGRITTCWAKTEEEGRSTAYQLWRSALVQGEAKSELPLPMHFDQITSAMGAETIAKQVLCGPDAGPHIQMFKQFADAGYTHVAVHQIGPDQEGLFQFYQKEVLPQVSKMGLVALG